MIITDLKDETSSATAVQQTSKNATKRGESPPARKLKANMEAHYLRTRELSAIEGVRILLLPTPWWQWQYRVNLEGGRKEQRSATGEEMAKIRQVQTAVIHTIGVCFRF